MTSSRGPIPGQRTSLAPLFEHAQDQDWTTQGLCVKADPDMLFVRGAQQRVAAKLCRACPVKLSCLADALDHRVEWGVWGGMTERERRALLRRRPDVKSWRQALSESTMQSAVNE